MTTETPTRIEVDCTTGEETIRPYTSAERMQRDADVLVSQQSEAVRVAEQARIDALKASIAAKRTATTWQPFTQEEVTYLDMGR